jgi:hypothetical protein
LVLGLCTLVRVTSHAALPALVMPCRNPLTWLEAHEVPSQCHTAVVQVPAEQLLLAAASA